MDARHMVNYFRILTNVRIVIDIIGRLECDFEKQKIQTMRK